MRVYAGAGNGLQLVQGISLAGFSIKILCYLFLAPRRPTGSGVTSKFYQTLKQKISEGVTIQILANDKFPTHWLRKKVQIERDRLRQIGATVKTFPRRNMLHSKLVLIDDRVAFLGSMNLTGDSMMKNHELLLRIDEKSITEELSKIFRDLWTGASQKNEGK